MFRNSVIILLLLSSTVFAGPDHAIRDFVDGPETACERVLSWLANTYSRAISRSPWLRNVTINTFVRGSYLLNAFDKHRSQPYSIKAGDVEIPFSPGDFIGQGAFGRVYHVHWLTKDPEKQALIPTMVSEGELRGDLAVKFARRPPIKFLREIWKNEIVKEYQFTRRIEFLLEEEGFGKIGGTSILYGNIEGDPFLIKQLYKDPITLKVLAQSSNAKLSEGQIRLLEVQIFNKAQFLSRKYGIAIDIRPENLFWDPIDNEWKLFELSPVPGNASFFTGHGFGNYLAMVNQELRALSSE